MSSTERRQIGPNKLGIPEDTVVDVYITFIAPPGARFRNARTGEIFTGEQIEAMPNRPIESWQYLGTDEDGPDQIAGPVIPHINHTIGDFTEDEAKELAEVAARRFAINVSKGLFDVPATTKVGYGPGMLTPPCRPYRKDQPR